MLVIVTVVAAVVVVVVTVVATAVVTVVTGLVPVSHRGRNPISEKQPPQPSPHSPTTHHAMYRFWLWRGNQRQFLNGLSQ